jgi:uncharacterized protein YjiS (DUF1127 family)
MSHMPMHTRFSEGFIESESSGETLDPVSSRILPARSANPDSGAVVTVLVRAGRFFATVFSAPCRSLIDRFVGWRRRERAAAELYAVDSRTLADIGVRRADIPFILLQGRWARHKPCAEFADDTVDDSRNDRHAAKPR